MSMDLSSGDISKMKSKEIEAPHSEHLVSKKIFLEQRSIVL